MIAFFSLVLVSYLVIMIVALRGWNIVRAKRLDRDAHKRLITVLVSFRNEEMVIHHLIHSLLRQDYPKENIEVICVDDHSEDNSYNVVKSLIYDQSNYRLLKQNEHSHGKKAAITRAVEMAKGEIIATTDADCVVPVNWLQCINDAYLGDNVNMAFGGVKLKTDKSFFSSLQAIEFTSLIGSMAASLGYRSFIMGNGANLSFRKAAFQFVRGFEGNSEIASGDDDFLARKVLKSFPDSLCFINTEEAVVTSRHVKSVSGFINQRIRWASKWRYNAFQSSGVLAIYVLLVQWATISVAIAAFRVREGMVLLIAILTVKVILECWFLYKVSHFLKSRWNWAAFVVLQFIYPFYVLGIGIASQVLSYRWKGRRISH